MNKRKTNKVMLVLNLIVLFLLLGVTTVFAADGDFSMTYRVVKGYEHKTYSFSQNVTKTVSVDAWYSFRTPDSYDSVWKDNKLNVTVEQEVKRFFGLITRWESVEDFACNYSRDHFTLNKSITLEAGKYGFTIWRNREEAYWDADGQPIVRCTVKGNVSFK